VAGLTSRTNARSVDTINDLPKVKPVTVVIANSEFRATRSTHSALRSWWGDPLDTPWRTSRFPTRSSSTIRRRSESTAAGKTYNGGAINATGTSLRIERSEIAENGVST
jgi:hypothetical protein